MQKNKFMYNLNYSQSATVLLIAIAITVNSPIPILLPTNALAQINVSPEITARIPAGTLIPIKYNGATKIFVAPDEPAPIPLTLTVARDITSSQTNLPIPAGTQIVGELVTMQETAKAQFVAKQIILNDGKQIPISASSRIISKTQVITNNPSIGRIFRNTALGTAAAAAVTAVTGDQAIASQAILLNSGFGSTPELIARFRNLNTVRLISIEPEKDLTLILNSTLILRSKIPNRAMQSN